MKVLADAIKRAGDDRRRRSCATPSPRRKDFAGVTGSSRINADRNAVKPAVVLELRGGKFSLQRDDPARRAARRPTAPTTSPAAASATPSTHAAATDANANAAGAGRVAGEREPLEREPLNADLTQSTRRGASHGHFRSAAHQRPDHRLDLRAHRARLHDGLRHPAADQLRARRHLHGRRVRRLLHRAPRSALPPSRRSWGSASTLVGSMVDRRARSAWRSSGSPIGRCASTRA